MGDASSIGRRRLVAHRIAGERLAGPAEVVRWMGAVQAQDYGQALWAIGLRTRAATVTDVERAIAERAIVLTWPMRGTLHFVPAEDARWMLDLLTPRVLAAGRARLAQLGLDDGTLERSQALFRAVLAGGNRLTRPALLEVLRDAGIDPAGQRGYHLLARAAQAGILCLGPLEGKQQTFALLDEWVPAPRRLAREEALATLTHRYVASHGPATHHDFAHWSGLTVAEARRGFEAAAAALSAQTVDGTTYWTAGDADGSTPPASAQPYLLPGFDEFLLGYRDRAAVLNPAHAHKVVPGKNGIFLPIVVQGGQVIGTWRGSRKKNIVTVTVATFTDHPLTAESWAQAAQRYQAFLGTRP